MLQFAKSKLQAVEMMKKISEHVTDHCILERIVPYLVSPYVLILICKSFMHENIVYPLLYILVWVEAIGILFQTDL